MTKVRIKNISRDSSEVQKYRVNQYFVLKPQESIELEFYNPVEFEYYKKLENYGFEVTEIITESEIMEETESVEDLSVYTDDQLKQVLYILGNSKVNMISKRSRIEDEVRSSLPEGKTVSDYL